MAILSLIKSNESGTLTNQSDSTTQRWKNVAPKNVQKERGFPNLNSTFRPFFVKDLQLLRVTNVSKYVQGVLR